MGLGMYTIHLTASRKTFSSTQLSDLSNLVIASGTATKVVSGPLGKAAIKAHHDLPELLRLRAASQLSQNEVHHREEKVVTIVISTIAIGLVATSDCSRQAP